MSDVVKYVYLTVNDTNINNIPIQLTLPFQTLVTQDLYNLSFIDQENAGLIWNDNLNQNFTLTTTDIKEETTEYAGEYTDENLTASTAVIHPSVNIVPSTPYVLPEIDKSQIKGLNLPETPQIRCQNCDTMFATKYQYQRHQCEFNAAKVVLKPEVKGDDIHTVIRAKYECDICKKAFISLTNLERHKQSHTATGSNTCEYCKKTFVSESRLQTHKANHCKKSGEVTKFYRSDVAVWHCAQCDQVFSSEQNGNYHVDNCASAALNLPQTFIKEENAETTKQVDESDNDFDANLATAIAPPPTKTITSKVEKIVTETLYQCEFCNRTYATKSSVCDHQKLHNTENNYECVFCAATFDNYNAAVLHWQNKCIDEADVFFLPKLVYCEFCDKGYKSHEVLYNHKNKKKHYTFKLHKADDNQHRFVVKEEIAVTEELTEKMPLTDITTMVENETCKKKRGRKRKYPKLEMTSVVVPPGYKYQCPRCGSVFDEVQNLETHNEQEHANIYQCNLCHQVLNSAKALTVHSRAHQSLKPYVCDKCGRSYSQTSHLWQHMRFHQGS